MAVNGFSPFSQRLGFNEVTGSEIKNSQENLSRICLNKI